MQQDVGRLLGPPVRVNVLMPSGDDPKRLEDDQGAQRADLSKMADAFSERIAEVQEQARLPRRPVPCMPSPRAPP